MASLTELFATAAKASSEFSHGVNTSEFVAKDKVAPGSPAAGSDTDDSDQDLDAFGSPMKPWALTPGRKTTGTWEEYGRSRPFLPSSSSSSHWSPANEAEFLRQEQGCY